MKNITIEELKNYNNPRLTTVIENWEDYNSESVLLAFAELGRRGYQIDTSDDILKFKRCLSEYLIEKGVKSYEDFLNENFPKLILDKNKKLIGNKSVLRIDNPKYIASAGKSLKIVVYSFLLLIACSFIGLFIIINTHDTETQKNLYVFLGFTSFILNIVILVSLHNAGDNLEKAVVINSSEDKSNNK